MKSLLDSPLMDSAPRHSLHDNRLKVLDGLRALAVLLVVLMHSLRSQRGDLSQPFIPFLGYDLSTLLYNGWIGVDLFFVLSGFLITRQLLSLNQDHRASRISRFFYYLKIRFFRVAPAYYLTLIIFLGISWFLRTQQGHPLATMDIENWSVRLISQMLFMHDYMPPLNMSVLWSLAVEAKFYLLAPLLIWGIATLPARCHLPLMSILILVLIVVRVVTILSSDHDLSLYENYFFDIRVRFHLSLDAILAGVMCALAWDNQTLRQKLKQRSIANILFCAGLILIAAVTVIHPIYLPQVSFFEMAYLPTALAAGFALMMLGLLGGCRGHSFFEKRIFHGIALVSYSLYLTHCLFLHSQLLTAQAIAHITGIQNTVLLWILSLPPFLLLTIAAAYMLYRYVEKPMIAWSKAKRPW